MAQSVEALLAPDVESAVRLSWERLAAVSLPTERRAADAAGSHRPHLTLWAGDRLDPGAERVLTEVAPALLAHFESDLVVGPLTIFGPRRGRCILVRLVVPDAGLLALQQALTGICGPGLGGQFHPGRWIPHVTIARRVVPEQLGPIVEVLAGLDGPEPLIGPCGGLRRWDGAERRSWDLGAERRA